LTRPEAIASLAALLSRVEGRNRARVTLCVTDPEGREIDIDLPDPYPVTPQIKGAIKSIQGVLAVEDL
jgi:DNA polymerase-3 subunit alpha